MDSTTENPPIKITELGSLNERKKFNNPDISQFDVLRNCIPTLAGSMSRMNGIKYLTEITGEEILGFCQANDSRGNIFVQTRTRLYQFDSFEFFGEAAYVPNLVNAAINEEDTMPIAIIVHQVAANVSGGTMAAGTAFQTAPLSAIISQINADGTAAAFASLAANQITLQAGEYRIRGWSKGTTQALSTKLRARLQNITVGSPAWNGAANENSDEGFTDVVAHNLKMEIGGTLSLVVPTVFEIQNRADTSTGTSTFGKPANDSFKEIYRWLEIIKTA